MYEVILGTCGIQQIGWATLQCPFTSEEGVGDAPDSYAWDGKRVQRWNVSPHPYGTPWASGDVVGVCADMEAGTLSFVKNGTDMGGARCVVASLGSRLAVQRQVAVHFLGPNVTLVIGLDAVAFSNIRNFQPGAAFFPALSISHGERSELNFGSQPFRYPVEGFQPIQVKIAAPPCNKSVRGADTLTPAVRPTVLQLVSLIAQFCRDLNDIDITITCIQDSPSPAQQEAAQYLLTAFRRLVRLSAPSGEQAEQSGEVFMPPSSAATAAGATIDDIDMLVDGPHAYAGDKDAHADPRRLLSVDDAVLLAAALARRLGPLLEDSYLVSHYVLPMLQVQSLISGVPGDPSDCLWAASAIYLLGLTCMLPTRLSHSVANYENSTGCDTHDVDDVCQGLLGKGPEHDEQLLGWAVQLLGLVLEPHEAQAMYSQLFAVLARAARTEQLCPSESPYAGPYSDLALAGARMSSTAPSPASLPMQRARTGLIPESATPALRM